MFDQAKYEPLEKSSFFENDASARPLPEHTVARGHLNDDTALHAGMDANGQPVTFNPVKLSESVLRRGQQRYGMFCTPCHGQTGAGDGMIVRRGYPKPASFHEERLREMPEGYFFDVVTNGFGRMPAYGSQIPATDRWAIIAYLRVLQESQGMTLDELSEDDRKAFETALKEPDPAISDPAGHHGDTDHEASAH